jgi:hypothetical protein
MPAYFFRSEPGAAELRRLARRESGRVCQRVLMIANMLEGMEHEEAGRLAGLSRSAAYEWHNRYEEDGIEGLRDRPRPGPVSIAGTLLDHRLHHFRLAATGSIGALIEEIRFPPDSPVEGFEPPGPPLR